MAKRYITDMQAGEHIESQVFLVGTKDLRTATNGSLYIHAGLSDKSGRINGRMWQASEALYNAMPQGGYVELKGRVESYKGNLQFIIDAVRPVDQDSVDPGDFMPSSEQDVDKMWARTLEILRGIKDRHVQLLIKQFVTDERIVAGYKKSPAAAVMHHAYVGGLCEHTLNLLEIASLIIPRYPELSLDLVLAGLFLHDIGKVSELNCEAGFTYSDEGQLLGHLTMGCMWIDQKCRQVEAETNEPFPETTKWALQHIVLSHHGQYEFGSPKLPALPEAIAIHHLDNLDAKLNTYLGLIKSDPDAKSHWTKYEHSLGTKIFKPDIAGSRRPRSSSAAKG